MSPLPREELDRRYCNAAKFDLKWRIAVGKLLQNLLNHNFVPKGGDAVNITTGESNSVLPAYIPYVGKGYFAYAPKVLCYAINQNLSRHVPWTKEWISRWAENASCAYDRLNRAFGLGEQLPIRPYAEGFIPLTALIAIWLWTQNRGGSLPEIVDDVIGVTNFVKFSTVADASSSSIPDAWWRESASRYVKHEIMVLQPDIIVGFGRRTVTELERVLRNPGFRFCKPTLLGCRFPGRIASNKARQLSEEESALWNSIVLPLVKRAKEPRKPKYHRWRMLEFPGYFTDTLKSWRSAL